MKFISLLLLHFAFIVAATAKKGFFNEGGDFSQKLEDIDAKGCIDDCAKYVSTEDCDSTCKQNTRKFENVVKKVYQRIQEPICDVNLGNISFGQVKIPLAIDDDNRRCYLEGSLNVLMKLKDQAVREDGTFAGTDLRYRVILLWTMAFKGLSVFCSACPSSTTQPVAQVDLTLHGFNEEIFQFSKQENLTRVYRDKLVLNAEFHYCDGEPKDIDAQSLRDAVDNAVTTAIVRNMLDIYFMRLSAALLDNCIVPNCPPCPKE